MVAPCIPPDMLQTFLIIAIDRLVYFDRISVTLDQRINLLYSTCANSCLLQEGTSVAYSCMSAYSELRGGMLRISVC